MNNYNHKKNELELLQKITNIISLIIELYSQNKISKEVYNLLLKEVQR